MFGLSESKYKRIFMRLHCNWNVQRIKHSHKSHKNTGSIDLVQGDGRWCIEEIVIEAYSYKLACITLAHELGHAKRFFQYGEWERFKHMVIAERREKGMPLTGSQARFLLEDEASAWKNGRDILIKIGVFDLFKDLFYSDSERSLASYCERYKHPNAKHIICNCFCPEKEVK